MTADDHHDNPDESKPPDTPRESEPQWQPHYRAASLGGAAIAFAALLALLQLPELTSLLDKRWSYSPSHFQVPWRAGPATNGQRWTRARWDAPRTRFTGWSVGWLAVSATAEY
jgi:hypothetical protein